MCRFADSAPLRLCNRGYAQGRTRIDEMTQLDVIPSLAVSQDYFYRNHLYLFSKLNRSFFAFKTPVFQ